MFNDVNSMTGIDIPRTCIVGYYAHSLTVSIYLSFLLSSLSHCHLLIRSQLYLSNPLKTLLSTAQAYAKLQELTHRGVNNMDCQAAPRRHNAETRTWRNLLNQKRRMKRR